MRINPEKIRSVHKCFRLFDEECRINSGAKTITHNFPDNILVVRYSSQRTVILFNAPTTVNFTCSISICRDQFYVFV